MKSNEIEIKKEPDHILNSRKIRPIQHWQEWLERWNAATTYEEMIALLQIGLHLTYHNEGNHNRLDRLKFYFSVADGWNDSYRFPNGITEYVISESNNGIITHKNSGNLSKLIAKKTYGILSVHFFKIDTQISDKSEKNVIEWWKDNIVNTGIFPIIQNFFRPKIENFMYEKISVYNLKNYTDDLLNHERNIVNFLLGLSKFLWEYEDEDVPTYPSSEGDQSEMKQIIVEFRKKIEDAKPWMIEILYQLEKLSVLEKYVLKFNTTTLEKLYEIAMRSELKYYDHPVKKDRKVATIDEAYYVGSPAALLIRMYEQKFSEHSRLSEIQEAEENIESSKQKIKELEKSS